ncbi:unnamed protein product [Trifolium pratense]|uniref:Uncharacterized protein n=1 Tax=Trifolium pratense TaxID=57577 RepID=A0ACB0JJ07_TRIPR|nr:unnamed protein product [Trifolium pratense]
MEEMSRNLVPPKNIMSTLKDRDPNNKTTAKQLYNLSHRLKLKMRASMTEMQHLSKRLVETGYFFKHRTVVADGSEHVQDIFFAHPKSISLFNSFPTVLLMDSTYKTNKYKMPLFEIVGFTSTGRSFNVGFAWLTNEREDNFTWALEQCVSLLRNEDVRPKLCARWPKFSRYVEETVLDTDKERVVNAWVDQHMHMGNHTTNRAESCHGVLKGYLKDGNGDLVKGWEAINKMLISQFTEVQGEFGRSMSVAEHRYDDDPLYAFLFYKISRKAMDHIYDEANRVEECGMDSKKCGCVMRRTYGLPCACLIAKKIKNNKPIRLDEIHPQWKKLCFEDEPAPGDVADDYDCLAEWKAIQERLKTADVSVKNDIRNQLRLIAYPETTSVKPPLQKAKTKGARKKKSVRVTRSTSRDKSRWEHVDDHIAATQASQSQATKSKPSTSQTVPEVDPDPIINTDTEQISQTPEGDIQIRFTPQRIMRIPRTMSSRYSTSEFHTAPIELSRASTSQIREDIESVENIPESSNDEVSYSSSSETSDNNDCQCNELSYWKSIVEMNGLNVLTSEQDEALKALESISDDNLRRKLIETLIRDNSREKTPLVTEAPYQLSEVLSRFRHSNERETPVSINDLKREINLLKSEISYIKKNNDVLAKRISLLENSNKIENIVSNNDSPSSSSNSYLSLLERVTSQKWFVKITLVINKNFILENEVALVDSGADLNCIQEGIIPTKYFVKTTQSLTQAGGDKLQVNYKLNNAYICNKNICLPTHFILVKNLTHRIILGTPFLHNIMPIVNIDQKGITTFINDQKITFEFITDPQTRMLNEVKDILLKKEKQLCFLKEEISVLNINEQLETYDIKKKIKSLEQEFTTEICNDLPNAFWDRKKHVVSLPYIDDFNESQIPTKARPAQMNNDYLNLCKKEIQSLLDKGLIRHSKSPWSCTAFYVNKAAEKERGVPRLVINYKPLNKVLKWIRYPIPNKKDLLDRLSDALIFSKFDMKSEYWQIQITENDKYKTAFTVPFGQYEWNVLPFGLKNAPSEFQKIMNDIFNPYSEFIIVYIDDVLVFSRTIDQHVKHLKLFKNVVKHNGLVLSATKMKIFQTKVRFLGHMIDQGTIIPIERSIEFASKFPDVMLNKTQLQRFLGSLNYISDYYKNLSSDTAILYNRLKNKPEPWTEAHTKAVQRIKTRVKCLPCLSLANPKLFKIVETDASNIGYGGILKQVNPETNKEVLVRFTSGKWNQTQVMTTPYRGRGRGRNSGRGGRGNNMLPYQESNIPLIGDWTSVGKPRQLPAPPKKEDQPSSSSNSNKIISYKEVMVNEPQEQNLEYFENPVTEKIIYIDDEDLSLTHNDGWSIKTRYLESRGYAGLYGIRQQSHQYSMADLKNYFQKKYPKETEEEIMIRILDHMKTQFLNTFPSTEKRDDMSTSSQGSIGQNMFEGLAGESQPEEEPTQEDFWDAMIQSIKTKRDKSQ